MCFAVGPSLGSGTGAEGSRLLRRRVAKPDVCFGKGTLLAEGRTDWEGKAEAESGGWFSPACSGAPTVGKGQDPVAHVDCILQNPGAARHWGPGRAEAKVVAAHGPLQPRRPRQRPGRWQVPQAAQLRWCLLCPGCWSPPRLPGGRPGAVVDQQPLRPGDAQRGLCGSCSSLLQPEAVESWATGLAVSFQPVLT